MELLAVFLPVALALSTALGLRLLTRAMRLKALGQVMDGADGEILRVQDDANCFGVDTDRVGQLRGNGCLALTRDELLFRKWLTRGVLRIPRTAITAVEEVDSHLGKRVGRTLLRVSFLGESGEVDSVAWLLEETEAWLGELRRPPAPPPPAREEEEDRRRAQGAAAQRQG